LLSFVRERNDGVEGHGLPGGYDPEADIAVIRNLIMRASPFLPTVAGNGETLFLLMLLINHLDKLNSFAREGWYCRFLNVL